MWAAMWDRASKQRRPSPWLCCSVHRPDPSLREEGLVVSQMGIAIIVTASKGCRLCRTNTVGYDGSYIITYTWYAGHHQSSQGDGAGAGAGAVGVEKAPAERRRSSV